MVVYFEHKLKRGFMVIKIKKLNSAGISHLLVPVLAIGLVAAAGSYMVFRSHANIDGTFDVNKIQVQLGPEEYVAGPTNALDTPYFTEKDQKGRSYGFAGNSDSFVIPLEEKSLLPTSPIPHDKTTIPKYQTILAADTAGSRVGEDPNHLDTCGAWILGSIYTDPKNANHWIGWYHAERNCVRGDLDGGDRTHMTIAYAESFDIGKHWTKPQYPNNRVITADAALEGTPAKNDTGNGRVIKIKDAEGEFYYMFYQANSAQDSNTGRSIHLARSKVSDLGRPGTWKKWYCTDPKVRSTCSFSQPGVGGKSTKLTNSDTFTDAWKNKVVLKDQYVTYNRYLNRYIAFGNDSGSFRFIASEGNDFKDWTSQAGLIKPMPTTPEDQTVDNWDRCSKLPAGTECKQLYGYNSIIGVKGDSDSSGQRFYIYYLKQFPGQGFGDGYIMRTKVTLIAGTATPTPARTELSLYLDKKGNQRITSELPEPWLGYQRKSKVGYVLSNPAPGYEPIFECKKPDGTYYTMRLAGASDYTMPVPSGTPTKCNAKDKLIRRIGWVSPRRTSEATEPIYDVSTVDGKAKRGSAIGYALPAIKE
jgi:hypothetical protein